MPSNRPPIHPIEALPEMIEASERRGQGELVAEAGTRLPTDGGSAWDLIVENGGTKGDVVDGDELFTEATLPPGWKVERMDHAMGSLIRDEHGRQRISIFYKAAFYDRRANMHAVATPTTAAQDEALHRVDEETWQAELQPPHGSGEPRWNTGDRGDDVVHEDMSVTRSWSKTTGNPFDRDGSNPLLVHERRFVKVAVTGAVILDGTKTFDPPSPR
jgi:hypothetical protein